MKWVVILLALVALLLAFVAVQWIEYRNMEARNGKTETDDDLHG